MIPSLMVYLEIHPPKREAQRACSLRDSWFHLSRLCFVTATQNLPVLIYALLIRCNSVQSTETDIGLGLEARAYLV